MYLSLNSIQTSPKLHKSSFYIFKYIKYNLHLLEEHKPSDVLQLGLFVF